MPSRGTGEGPGFRTTIASGKAHPSSDETGFGMTGVETSDNGEMAERFKAAVLKTAVGLRPPWVRIPLSPPDTQGPPQGGFCVSGGAQCVDERTRFDTSAGLPMCTAQPPEGRGPWMARVNPTLSATQGPPQGGFCVSGGAQCVDERTRFDTSAGLPMCTAQPPGGRGPWRARVNPTLSATQGPRKGAFAYLTERNAWTNALDSTHRQDCRCARRSRPEGEGHGGPE